MDKKIAFIGTGFMGGALLRGLINADAADATRIIAADPREQALTAIKDELKINVTKSNAEAVNWADIVILAVKPQVIEKVVKDLGRKLNKKKLVISIAAGVKLGALASWTPSGSRIIRAMPNINAAVSQAATAICAGMYAEEIDIAIARQIFNAVGESVVVDEHHMDAVTGLSGSGPAFVFMFIESLIDAGVRCGLARDVARILAIQTVLGSARMIKLTDEHPAVLKDRVTSPGGTTIAGLSILEDAGFRGDIIRAVEEAANRSRELGG